MPRRSYRSAIALITIAGLVALVIFGDLAIAARWAVVLADSAHGPVSAVIAALVFQGTFLDWQSRNVPHLHPLFVRWLKTVGITIAIGIAIELVQSQIGRDAEFTDVITDLLGALAGAGLCVFFAAEPPRRSPHYAALASAVLASVLIIAPVAIMTAAYWQRDHRFPVLMDGNAPLGGAFIIPFWVKPERETLPASAMPVTPGEKGLRIYTGKEKSWSLALQEFQQDWRSWQTLVVEIANPGDAKIDIRMRVYDRPDGLANDMGYIAALTLNERSRALWKISLRDMEAAAGTQRVDLSHIEGLILFPDDRSRNQEVYLLNIRLE